MARDEAERNGIQVISRAAAILRCLENEAVGLSLGAIAKRSGLPRSTVQRLVDALVLEQLLEVRGAGGVCLGPALMRLAARSHIDITQVARPFLEDLSARTGETSVLVHASGTDLMILQSVISPQELRVAPSSGNFLKVFASSGGKVLLAYQEDSAVRTLLANEMRALTPNTLGLEPLIEQLAEVRRDGFAYDREEHSPGVAAVGIGVQTSQGHYAVSTVGPSWRIESNLEEIRQALIACRDGLVAALRSM
ncbi:IclR family transcriptional regulator [Pseudomonas sp. nanlin1]|uniref:IclR family transcriptional regulator n=1 Tax=Pseudomonas sp. nanlin1 TaxID=3040605 RepID=UPI003890CAEE